MKRKTLVVVALLLVTLVSLSSCKLINGAVDFVNGIINPEIDIEAAEVRGIAGVVLLPFLPDELLLRLPQSHGTPSQTLWNGDGTVAVPGFG